MYNIGIIGLGFVGGAMFKSFTLKNINLEVYDKYKNGGIGSLDNMCKKDFLFLCLPTIFDEKKNSYNKDPIYETCEFLEKNDYCFSSLLQLVYVLPQSQYHLLPDKVVNYVKSNYKCLTNSNFPIKWAFCRYFWESHIEFDTIPIDMLIKLDGELLVL